MGNGADHFIHRNAVAVLEQRELAHLDPILLLAVGQGIIGRVVFVFAGEDFLVGAHMDATVDQRQAFSGAAGEGDLFRCGLEITTGPDPHLVLAFFGFSQVPIHRQAGVAVEVGAVHLDRLAHGSWV
ncbi:hypothetical protein D3C86_1718130 [compost metagenome]